MTARSFVDTNVLVYVHDHRDPSKQRRAIEVLGAAQLRPVFSTQVLGEFYVTVTRKLGTPVDARRAADLVAQLSRAPVVQIDATLVGQAIVTSRQFQLSYWDALIVEAAVAGACDRLLSEDLAAGSVIRGVRIENPFAADST